MACEQNAPSERGFVLLPVLTLLMLLASVILVLNRENASGLSVGARELEVNAASFVAEAGLQHAIWKASSTGACSGYTDLVDVPFGEHAYSASYSKKAGSPVAITATGALASGAKQTLLSANTPVYQEATTMVLSPAAAEGQDTTIWDQKPDENYGADVELGVRQHDTSVAACCVSTWTRCRPARTSCPPSSSFDRDKISGNGP